MRRKHTMALATSAVMLLFGCGKDQEPAGPNAESAMQAFKIDNLRSIPYVGFVEDDDERSGVVEFERSRAQPGYNLYSVFQLASAFLIDMDGEVVKQWSDPEGYHWAHVELTPEGDLLVTGSRRTAPDQRRIDDKAWYAMRLTWDGERVWQKPLTAHHDVELSPDGRLATLTWSRRRVPHVHKQAMLRDEQVTILSPAGDVLLQHSLYDMLSSKPAMFQFQPVRDRHFQGFHEVELFHANSVELMRHPELAERDALYAATNALVSTRHQDAIFIVNLQTHELVWTWGRGEILGPHDATVLESGNILLYDNGLGRGWSRVIELDPLERKIVWEYRADPKEDFYSKSRGANQRLTNGNTLITDSDHGRAFEVTPSGEIVWEYLAPHHKANNQRATIVRMNRYDEAFIDGLMRCDD